MAEQSLKDKTVKGIVWSAIEKFSVQGVQFLVMLVIARILSPKDFGLIGMMAIFIAVSDSLCNSGFSQALIRKQNRTEADNSTVFYFNVVVSLVLYLILYFAAPWVAEFYNEPELTVLMRVLCLIVIIHSFAVVQRAVYTANLNFKIQAKASFIAAVISGFIGIVLALNGFGVWTLVWQQLLNAGLLTLLLWFYSSWHPRFFFSWKSFRDLFSFGSKLMVSGLLDTVYNNIYQLVIGKVFTASSLGYFTQAKTFANFPSANISTIIQRVTYPVLCKLQDDDNVLRNNYRQLLRLSAFIIFPLMCLLAGVSKPLITTFVGEKWSFAAQLLIPLSFSMMWYPIHAINLNLLQVKGRSDLFLKLEIIKKIIGVSILFISIPFGLTFLCWSRIATSLLSLFLNTYYTGKLIHVNFFVQMGDIVHILLMSLISFFIAFACQYAIPNSIVQIIVGGVLGISFYLGGAFLLQFTEIKYLKKIIKK